MSPRTMSQSRPVFTVTASDGELTDSADIFLSLNDVAFKPADRNSAENVVVENWRQGRRSVDTGQDLTGHGEVTFSLQDNPHFEMHPTTGKVTVKEGKFVATRPSPPTSLPPRWLVDLGYQETYELLDWVEDVAEDNGTLGSSVLSLSQRWFSGYSKF